MESPRWLLSNDPFSVEARVVIKNMRGFRTDAEVETEVICVDALLCCIHIFYCYLFVLYCIVLYCIVLYCIVLYCVDWINVMGGGWGGP